MAEETKKRQPPPKKEPQPIGHEPWLPPEWEPADATALQALAAGTADANQQKRALKWVIEMGADTYGLGWHPGGANLADFSAGRRFVGLQVVKLLKLNVGLFTGNRENG
jgi:hypothetical protein